MRALLARRFDDLRRSEPNAFIDYVDAGVARAHGDLLGAVRVPVEARLAEHEFEPPAELTRHSLDFGAQVVEADGFVARRTPHASRRAILAEALTQGKTPFAGGDAGFGADDRGGHDVAIFSGRSAQLLERCRDRPLVARAAPGLEALDLLGFRLWRDRHDGINRACERR